MEHGQEKMTFQTDICSSWSNVFMNVGLVGKTASRRKHIKKMGMVTLSFLFII